MRKYFINHLLEGTYFIRNRFRKINILYNTVDVQFLRKNNHNILYRLKIIDKMLLYMLYIALSILLIVEK